MDSFEGPVNEGTTGKHPGKENITYWLSHCRASTHPRMPIYSYFLLSSLHHTVYIVARLKVSREVATSIGKQARLLPSWDYSIVEGDLE